MNLKHSISLSWFFLFFYTVANANIDTYTDRSTWLTAAGGSTDFDEGFSSFGMDTDFRLVPVVATGFTIQQMGVDEFFRNYIDATPFTFSDNNGTNHASCFVNTDGATTVELLFDSPINAWFADFTGICGLELLDVELFFVGGGSTILQVCAGPQNTGFGVLSSAPEGPIEKVQFRGRNNEPGGGGEGFGLDNISGVHFSVPSISQTDYDGDGIPDITDPCSCGDPLNIIDAGGMITHFHDFVMVTSGPGETWEISSLNSGAIFDAGLAAIPVGTVLPEIAPGVYRLDLFHPDGVGFNVTVDRTAGGGPFPLTTGGTCSGCPLVGIPTMGQWGLIILALLLLSFATVFMMRRQAAFADIGNVSAQSGGIPFDKAVFGKMLTYVVLGLAATFAIAVSIFGYEITTADVPGSLIAGPVLAYLLHLLLPIKNNN